MCEVAAVPAGGYYARTVRPDRSTELRRQERARAITAVHAAVTHRYGRPPMTAEPKARGRENSGDTAAENRWLRGFGPSGPGEARSADLTPIPTRARWPYRTVVEDLRGSSKG